MIHVSLTIPPFQSYWEGSDFTLTAELVLQYNTGMDWSHDDTAIVVQAYLSSDTQWDGADRMVHSTLQERGTVSFL